MKANVLNDVIENLEFVLANRELITQQTNTPILVPKPFNVYEFNYAIGICGNVGLSDISQPIMVELVSEYLGKEEFTSDEFLYPVNGRDGYIDDRFDKSMYTNPKRWEFTEFSLKFLKNYRNEIFNTANVFIG